MEDKKNRDLIKDEQIKPDTEMSLEDEIQKAREEGKSEAWIRLNLDI